MKSIRLCALLLLATLAYSQNTAKFPGAVPTAADLGVASNRAETTLATGVNATATSIPVLSSTGFKAGGFATIDNEILRVCAVPDGNHLTVGLSACPNVDGRGTDSANGGGAAAAHLANIKVQGRIVAWNMNQAAAEIAAMAHKLHLELISVKDFGAKGDGSTDDGAAIQAANDAYQGDPTAGAVINFPCGTYITNQQIVQGKYVSFLGQNSSCAILMAGPSFPTTGVALVKQGNLATAPAGIYHSLIREMTINGNGRAETGVYSDAVNELSGLEHVSVIGWTKYGVHYYGGFAQNFTLNDLWIFPRPSAGTPANADADGLWLESVASANPIIRITVAMGAGNDTCPCNGTGIRVTSSHVQLIGVHVELADVGVFMEFAHASSLQGFVGHSTTTTAVKFANSTYGATAAGISLNGTTNSIVDLGPPVTITEDGLAYYSARGNPLIFGNGSVGTILRGDFAPNTASRSWFVGMSQFGYGDFAIMKSSTKLGDPLAGTCAFYQNPAGQISLGSCTPTASFNLTIPGGRVIADGTSYPIFNVAVSGVIKGGMFYDTANNVMQYGNPTAGQGVIVTPGGKVVVNSSTDSGNAAPFQVVGDPQFRSLAGTGNAFACLDANGVLWRKATACTP